MKSLPDRKENLGIKLKEFPPQTADAWVRAVRTAPASLRWAGRGGSQHDVILRCKPWGPWLVPDAIGAGNSGPETIQEEMGKQRKGWGLELIIAEEVRKKKKRAREGRGPDEIAQMQSKCKCPAADRPGLRWTRWTGLGLDWAWLAW